MGIPEAQWVVLGQGSYTPPVFLARCVCLCVDMPPPIQPPPPSLTPPDPFEDRRRSKESGLLRDSNPKFLHLQHLRDLPSVVFKIFTNIPRK